jgi:hypothetical protein
MATPDHIGDFRAHSMRIIFFMMPPGSEGIVGAYALSGNILGEATNPAW